MWGPVILLLIVIAAVELLVHPRLDFPSEEEGGGCFLWYDDKDVKGKDCRSHLKLW